LPLQPERRKDVETIVKLFAAIYEVHNNKATKTNLIGVLGGGSEDKRFWRFIGDPSSPYRRPPHNCVEEYENNGASYFRLTDLGIKVLKSFREQMDIEKLTEGRFFRR
jgi:hypothetical protein